MLNFQAVVHAKQEQNPHNKEVRLHKELNAKQKFRYWLGVD